MGNHCNRTKQQAGIAKRRQERIKQNALKAKERKQAHDLGDYGETPPQAVHPLPVARIEPPQEPALASGDEAHNDLAGDALGGTPVLPTLEPSTVVTRKQKRKSIFPRPLPRRFAWENVTGNVLYTDEFIAALNAMSPAKQMQAIRRVDALCSHGPTYPSLKSRYLGEYGFPNSPTPCNMSRASRSIRFSWVRENTNLTIYFICPRGASRLGFSEN